MREIVKGSTSITLMIVLRDSTTGLGKTALAFGDITGSYTRNRAARTAITMATLASASAAWSSGGFVEIDATNCPGLYRWDIPDAAFATGVRNVVISAKATGVITEHEEVILTGWDNQDAVRGGLTALPNAAAGATGGLDCAVAFGGTASAGAANSITLAGASATDNIYNHQVIQITGGTGVGQARTITAYNGTTKVAIVSRAWRTNPDNTSVYQIKGFDFQPSTSVVGGFAQAATSTTVTLPTTASAVDSYYNGALLCVTGGTAVGQTRIITAYNGTTKVATVSRAFQTTPDTTSVVIVFQASQPRLDASLAVDVANVNSGAIVAASFAAGAIDAAAIATDAIGSAELAASAVTEIQAGLATSASIATLQSDTDDIQTRLPAALVSGRMDSSVGAIATGAIVSGSFAVDSITSGALSNGACDEIADHVWDELLSGHVISGSAGETLAAAGSAGDPWSTLVPGAYGAGTAGKILGDNLDAAISTRATPAQVNTEVVDVLSVDAQTEIATIPAATATLAEMVRTLYAFCTNKVTATGSVQTLRNRADAATIGTSAESDDTTTFVRGSFS